MIRLVISLTRAQKNALLLFIDLALVPVALMLAFMIQYSTINPLWGLIEHWPLIPLLMIAAAGVAFSLGLPSIQLKEYHASAVVRSGVLSAMLALASAALAAQGTRPLEPGFHVVFGLLFLVLTAGARFAILQILLAIYRRSSAVTRVLIYGAGRSGMALASALKGHPEIVPVAFLDDNATLRGLVVCGLPVHSGIHIEKVLAEYKINRVILAMPSLSADKQTYLSRRMEKLGLEVQTLPAFAQFVGGEALVDKLHPAGPAALLSREHLHEVMGQGFSEYRDATVMISGAGGSIGLELCRQVAVCRPRRMILFELSEIALYNAEAEIRVLTETSNISVVPVLGSVTDPVLVERVMREHQVQVVLHAAAYKHVPLVETNPRVGLHNNAIGTAVLAQKARETGVGRFVLVSSDKAVRPGNVMGASKRFAELVVQDLAMRPSRTIFSIVRFGNVLGSSGSVIPLFQEQIARGGPVTLTDERVTRYFMTVQEAARLVLLAGAFAEGGEVFVLDMGKPVLIRDLARQLIEASGYRVRCAADPQGDIEIVTTGLRPGEKLHEELMLRPGAQTTAHPKIIRVREDHLSEIATAAALRDLREAIESGDDMNVIAVLAHAIPEYDPQSLPDTALPMQVMRRGNAAGAGRGKISLHPSGRAQLGLGQEPAE